MTNESRERGSMPAGQTRSRLLGVGLTLVVLVGVLPFVAFAVPQVVGANHGFVVLSDSMAPTINAGDAVIVDSVDPASIEEGDVITFQRSADLLVTHRVIGVAQDGGLTFETKGDNNEDPDPQPIGPDQVVGEVMIVLPLVGYVVNFAGTPLGLGVLVGVPFGLLFLSELWAMYRGGDEPAPTSQERTLEDYGDPTSFDPQEPRPHPAPTQEVASPTVVSLGPGTDVTLTIAALTVLAIYSATIGIRTGFPESYAVSAFAVFTIAGLLYVTRGEPPAPATTPTTSNGDGGGAAARIDPFDEDPPTGGSAARVDVPEDVVLDAEHVEPVDDGPEPDDDETDRKRERPPTAGEPTIQRGEQP